MYVPLAAPLREGAWFDCTNPILDDRSARLADLIAPAIAAAPCQNRAAIKPSLTVSWLILPSSAQAP
jgi:hypothetical protein